MVILRQLVLVALISILFGCSQSSEKSRWFSAEQVARGKIHYMKHCASCHKPQGQGTAQWRKPTADGHYPPPPLNDDAHAWHHPNYVLFETIKKGGIALGGVMPAFGDKLSDAQIMDVIAYFQSFWSDDIYNIWLERNKS